MATRYRRRDSPTSTLLSGFVESYSRSQHIAVWQEKRKLFAPLLGLPAYRSKTASPV